MRLARDSPQCSGSQRAEVTTTGSRCRRAASGPASRGPPSVADTHSLPNSWTLQWAPRQMLSHLEPSRQKPQRWCECLADMNSVNIVSKYDTSVSKWLVSMGSLGSLPLQERGWLTPGFSPLGVSLRSLRGSRCLRACLLPTCWFCARRVKHAQHNPEPLSPGESSAHGKHGFLLQPVILV